MYYLKISNFVYHVLKRQYSSLIGPLVLVQIETVNGLESSDYTN